MALFDNFEQYNKELLREAIVYSDIAKQPNRKKCALLTWQGMKEVVTESGKNE